MKERVTSDDIYSHTHTHTHTRVQTDTKVSTHGHTSLSLLVCLNIPTLVNNYIHTFFQLTHQKLQHYSNRVVLMRQPGVQH